jgi:hypothetical protein
VELSGGIAASFRYGSPQRLTEGARQFGRTDCGCEAVAADAGRVENSREKGKRSPTCIALVGSIGREPGILGAVCN